MPFDRLRAGSCDSRQDAGATRTLSPQEAHIGLVQADRQDQEPQATAPRPTEFPPSFSSAFHKETQASTVSAQRRAGFLLMGPGEERRVSIIQARCSACPARALRQSRRFLVVLEGELPGGFLHKRVSARELVARACGLLTESSTHGRTGRRPPECCRLIRGVRFASDNLPSAS
jgi:hypothetical protein